MKVAETFGTYNLGPRLMRVFAIFTLALLGERCSTVTRIRYCG
jgi:hypothetical protein